jgi:hypothetical protein
MIKMTQQTAYCLNEDNLEKLSHISKQLNTATQEFNDKIAYIQNKLRDMDLGVTAWTSNPIIIPVSDNGESEKYILGFCKYKNFKKNTQEWTIVCKRLNNYPNNQHLVPLLTAPRIIRMESCGFIDELIQNLLTKAEKFLNDIDERNDVLDNIKV